MSATKIFFASLLGICCGWSTVQAQGPYPQPVVPGSSGRESMAVQPRPEPVQESGTGLSSWITYARCNGCNSPGCSMPVKTEVFARIGPTFTVGGEVYSRNLDVGWMIAGGARALFFDRSFSAAWTADLSISNTYNPSSSGAPVFLNHHINRIVTIRSLDRTFANLGFGREWYPFAPANSDDPHLRFGIDVGGRYGSAKAEFNEIRHRTNVLQGFYGALHTDLEVPCGRCIYLAGIRGEYSFTFSNIFGPGRGQVQDISLLFNLGVRF